MAWHLANPPRSSNDGYVNAYPPRPAPPVANGFAQVLAAARAANPTAGWQPPTPVQTPNPTPPAPILDQQGQPYANQVTAGAYQQPWQREQQLRESGLSGIGALIHRQALAYANQRLGALKRIAGVVNDPTLSLILASNGDPLQVYAAASKQWAKLAHDAGYADPRIWLRDKIHQTHMRSGHDAAVE